MSIRESERLTLAIVVPAYNEAPNVAPLLDHLSQSGCDELVFVDGSSPDGTAALARRHSGVRVLETPPSRAGQMNAGAAVCASDIILFLHADVRMAPGAVAAVRRAMAVPGVVGGTLNIVYEGGDFAARVFTVFNRWRRAFGVFYGDAGIFCRRDWFQKLGGYRDWPIMEDYEFARRLWWAGRLAHLDDILFVSDRRWRNGGLFRTLWSWFVIQTLYYLWVPPRRLARLYKAIR